MRYVLKDNYVSNDNERFLRFEIYDEVEGRYIQRDEYPFDIEFNTYGNKYYTISEIEQILTKYCMELNFNCKFMEHIK